MTLTFARGAALTTAATLGHGDTSNLGPTAGNGFRTRWPDDLAALQQIGVTDLRLSFDWARLQPKPGDLDSGWADWYDQLLAAADAIGLRIWATLHDRAEPQWISNEGSFDERDVATKWWPRYVERVADRFGGGVGGWCPFAEIDADISVDAWTATWTTLRGELPVVASYATDSADRISTALDACDAIGIALSYECSEDDEPSDDQLGSIGEHLHADVMRVAELAEDTSLIVSEFTADHEDADVQGQLVERFVVALDEAIADGAALSAAFVDPAISGADSMSGLLDAERSATAMSAAYLDQSGNQSEAD